MVGRWKKGAVKACKAELVGDSRNCMGSRNQAGVY